MDQMKTPKEAAMPGTTPAAVVPPAAKSKWRDVFIYATVALVGVALGAALNLQMDIEPELAAAIAVLVALALLQAHQLLGRGREIAALRRDVADLRRASSQQAPGLQISPLQQMSPLQQRIVREPTAAGSMRPVTNTNIASGNGGSGPAGNGPAHGANPAQPNPAMNVRGQAPALPGHASQAHMPQAPVNAAQAARSGAVRGPQ